MTQHPSVITIVMSIGMPLLLLMVGVIGFFLKSTLSDMKDCLKGIQIELKNQNDQVALIKSENSNLKEKIFNIQIEVNVLKEDLKQLRHDYDKGIRIFYDKYLPGLNFLEKYTHELMILMEKMKGILP